MKQIENDCVGCPDGVPCLGSTCPMRNGAHYYCDKCGDEAELYKYEGGEYCATCIEKMSNGSVGIDTLEVVEGS
jgi:hypothetical protein